VPAETQYDATTVEQIDKISFKSGMIWDMENFDFRKNKLFVKNAKEGQLNYTLNAYELPDILKR